MKWLSVAKLGGVALSGALAALAGQQVGVLPVGAQAPQAHCASSLNTGMTAPSPSGPVAN